MRLKNLTETADIDVRKMGRIAQSAPKNRERGWIGDKKFTGDKSSVTIKYDPTEMEDVETWQRFACHTHPDNGNPIAAFPSVQDLNAFSKFNIKNLDEIDENGSDLIGIVVFCGKNYVKLQNKNLKDRLQTSNYEKALKTGDTEGAIKALEAMGFMVETDTI